MQSVKLALAKHKAYKRARKLWYDYLELTNLHDKVSPQTAHTRAVGAREGTDGTRRPSGTRSRRRDAAPPRRLAATRSRAGASGREALELPNDLQEYVP